MMVVRTMKAAPLALAVLVLAMQPAWAARCEDPAGFQTWIETVKREAAAQGISQRTLASLNGITRNTQVIALDRSQKAFKQSFEQFAAQRISKGRLNKGAGLLRSHAGLLGAIERRYGVPGPVIVAIWGLETDFGGNTGNMSVLRSPATLAYDCRRTVMFQRELMGALQIVDRGDMSADQLRGAWAGEVGQTQFLASNYIRFAVDFDGDGRRDLIRGIPDVLASAANYLKSHGWQRGGDWQPGTANFQAIKQWNKSDVYARTIALFATRLAGR
jgi:lytic murein transglycosylase